MLYIIGLGLSDFEDVTIKGLNAIKSSDLVYLEHYTSILKEDPNYKEELEKFYGKKITLADRTMVEQNSDEIIENARDKTVSFLVVGDPFGATTHTDFVIRAIEKGEKKTNFSLLEVTIYLISNLLIKGIKYKIIHNVSILNAVGCSGLQLYSFGETISVCFWSEKDNWRPKSYFPKICENRKRGLHTLCLLDIKVKEKSVENLIRGREIYEPARYQSVSQACEQLCEIIDEEEESPCVTKETICVGLARVGKDDQLICVDTLKNLAGKDMGGPLHSLIVAGKLHPLEIDYIKIFYNGDIVFDELAKRHNKIFS